MHCIYDYLLLCVIVWCIIMSFELLCMLEWMSGDNWVHVWNVWSPMMNCVVCIVVVLTCYVLLYLLSMLRYDRLCLLLNFDHHGWNVAATWLLCLKCLWCMYCELLIMMVWNEWLCNLVWNVLHCHNDCKWVLGTCLNVRMLPWIWMQCFVVCGCHEMFSMDRLLYMVCNV